MSKNAEPRGKVEVILSVAAEGGSITLYGVRSARGWAFERCISDQTPTLLDEPALQHDSGTVHSWDTALELLDRYPWHRLSPRAVHPEFRSQLWREIELRDREGLVPERRLEDWRRVCAAP